MIQIVIQTLVLQQYWRNRSTNEHRAADLQQYLLNQILNQILIRILIKIVIQMLILQRRTWPGGGKRKWSTYEHRTQLQQYLLNQIPIQILIRILIWILIKILMQMLLLKQYYWTWPGDVKWSMSTYSTTHENLACLVWQYLLNQILIKILIWILIEILIKQYLMIQMLIIKFIVTLQGLIISLQHIERLLIR